MGLFSAQKTWTDLANEVPAERSTWLVEVGEFDHATVQGGKVTNRINEVVADVEAAGWRLESLVPGTRGVGGVVSTSMVAVFRRA